MSAFYKKLLFGLWIKVTPRDAATPCAELMGGNMFLGFDGILWE